MSTNNAQNNLNSSPRKFFDWLYIYRLPIMIIGLLLVAIIVVSSIYLARYAQTSKISFTSRSAGKELEYETKISTLSDISHFNLSYELVKQKRTKDDNPDYYKVEFKYNDVYVGRIQTIRLTLLVHQTWVKDGYDFLSSTVTYNTSSTTPSSTVTVNYTHELPTNPMLFIKTTHPTLYIKVEVYYKDDTPYKYYVLRDFSILGNLPRDGYDI